LCIHSFQAQKILEQQRLIREEEERIRREEEERIQREEEAERLREEKVSCKNIADLSPDTILIYNKI